MVVPAYPAGEQDYGSAAAEQKRIDAAMRFAPAGALVVAGIATGLLILCWLIIYFAVFLPRGTVG